MNTIKAIIIYLIAIIVCCPCLLIVSEGDTILPNVIGFCYLYALFLLRNTKTIKNIFIKINDLNNHINKKDNDMGVGGYPIGAENDPHAPYNQDYKEVIVNVDLTLTVTKTIPLVMVEGYDKDDLFDEVTRYVKDLTITDNDNYELTIDDFEIDDYYE